MRTSFILGLFILGLTSLSFAQNDIAYLDTSVKNKTSIKNLAINANFINAMSTLDIPTRIKSFQKFVADYDITNESSYTPDVDAIYQVTFSEDGNTIKNRYNNRGEILKSEQRFDAIRLPFALSAEVAKNNPGWYMSAVQCQITYTEGQQTKLIYKVKLKKDGQTKTIKIS